MEKKNFFWFLTAAFCLMATVGCWDPSLSNYLNDVFKISDSQRGFLEFPREFPGFMVVVMTGLLAALPVARVGVIASLLCVLGLVSLATFVGKSYPGMIAMMVLISSGVHLNMPVVSTITLNSAGEGKRGRRLGQVESLTTVGFLLGAGVVWLISHIVHGDSRFNVIFFCAAGFAALGGFCYSRLNLPDLHQKRARLVLKRKFNLYYWLEFLFGARKQVFLTFGPWVLITVYGLEVSSIAKLYMVSSLVGVGFKLIAGRAVDRFGERNVLTADAI
ncbi:MAG: MFS transporter, partial [Sedimentisphaerales bacterium]|nr:MFS transporter [Sedimentisphaerales bacterium]